MNDEELARAYRARMRQGALPPDAPDPEAIQRVASGRATEAERLQVLDAVMQSEPLRREFDVFRALSAGDAPLPARRMPRHLLALAASLLVVVMAGSLWWQRHPANPEPTRGEPSAVSLIAPVDGATAAAPVALRWAAVPGATSYAVEVLAADGRLVFRAQGTDTVVVLPGTAPVLAGESYVWRVVATGPGGRQLESESRAFSGAP